MIENFAVNLINLRKQAGLSQKELAKKLEISSQTLSNIENQTSYPTFTNLEKIAEFFNATPNQLFGTPTQIELENSVYKTDEYSEKAKIILSAIEKMEEIKNDSIYRNILWLSRGPQMFDPNGEPMYEDYDGKITSNPDFPIADAYCPSPMDNLLESIKKLQESGTYSELLRLTRGPQKFAPNGDELYEDYDGNITNFPNSAVGYAYHESPIKQLLKNAEKIRDLARDVAYIKENSDVLKKDSE